MPIWQIFHPDAVFTDPATKQALSEAITSVYTASGELPGFYVGVLFIPLPKYSMFRSGKPVPSDNGTAFIRITFSHYGRHLEPERKKNFLAKIDAVLQPFILDKGWDLEYQCEESDEEYLRINAMRIPLANSEGEKLWREENRPVPYGPYLKE